MSGARSRAGGAAKTPARRPAARKAVARLRGVRWWVVLVVAAAVLVGLPLAHAFLGELGAVLLGTFVAGFGIGRATAR